MSAASLPAMATCRTPAALNASCASLLAIEKYPWPGNVRELENRVRRAVIMSEGAQVTSNDLELQEVEAAMAAEPRTLKEAREALERDLVMRALRRHSGKIAPAATDLGISRPTFYELMEKLGIQKQTETDA